MSTTAVFAGYAYYSASGDGFVYALSNTTGATTLSAPVVVVDGVSKADYFFEFLFLVAGGALSLLLLIIVAVAFCCRQHVARLEEKYWRLQHAYAETNNALVQEVLHRTPAGPPKRQPSVQRQSSSHSMRSQQQQQQQQQPQAQMQQHNTTQSARTQQQQQQPAPMQRRSSANSMRSQQPPPRQASPQPQQMQRYNSTSSMRQPQQQPQQQQAQTGGMYYDYPSNNNPWMLSSEPLGVYPPRQPSSQPLFAAQQPAPAGNPMQSNYNAYDYNNMYAAAPPILSPSAPQQQQQQQQYPSEVVTTSPSATPDALRRRESRVRFVGA